VTSEPIFSLPASIASSGVIQKPSQLPKRRALVISTATNNG
jgi:hypothetical protein